MLLILLASFSFAQNVTHVKPSYLSTEWIPLSPLNDENALDAPPPPVLPEGVERATIFVGIAAFRERRCGKTLFSAFTQARFPNRVYFGVNDEWSETDDAAVQGCMFDFCALMRRVPRQPGWPLGDCPFSSHVRVRRGDADVARGPTFARYWQQSLLRDERFCVQCDSHSLFATDWDVLFIQDWLRTNNEMAILSTYAAHVDQIDVANQEMVMPHICKTMGGGHGLIRNQQASAVKGLWRPKLNTLWGAGLSFGKCHAEVLVPYDPHLDHIFDGEEYSRAARLFTWGYDLYTPHRNRLFHNYTHVAHRWHASAQSGNVERGVARLRKLLGLPTKQGHEEFAAEYDRFGQYGYGRCRSVEALEAFTGVVPSMGVQSDGKECGDLIRVPVHFGDEMCDPMAVYESYLDKFRPTTKRVATRAPSQGMNPLVGQTLVFAGVQGIVVIVLLCIVRKILTTEKVKTQRLTV